jgi:hypothetical protein
MAGINSAVTADSGVISATADVLSDALPADKSPRDMPRLTLTASAFQMGAVHLSIEPALLAATLSARSTEVPLKDW